MRQLLLIGVLLTLPGCIIEVPPSSSSSVPAAQQALAGRVVTGRVLAPVSVIAASGANVIGAGGANVIAAGGLNYRGLLAVQAQPLASTRVYLADAAGNAVPGVAAVMTDAEGRYQFDNVRQGHTYSVVAEAKTVSGDDAKLKTLVKPGDLGATADIDAATTMVTAAVVDQHGGSLASFNPVSFKNVTDATARSLTDEQLPDFTSPAAVLAKMNELAAAVAEIRTSLDELKEELAEIKSSLKEVHSKLDQLLARQQAPSTGESTPTTAGNCDGTFRMLDGNGDSIVTVEEWTAKIPPDPETGESSADSFFYLDQDYDGVLAQQEWLRLCEMYSGTDSDF